MSTSTLPAELPRTRRAIPSLVWNKLLLSRTAHQEAHQPRRIPKLRTQPSSTFTILSSSSQATSSHISTFSHAPEQDELFASNIQACASNNAWEGKMLLAPEKSLNVPERVPASPPPLYDDPIHPWAMCARDPAAGSSSTSSSTGAFVIGDDDAKEKEEALPPYVCTVSRAGRVHIKKEMDSPQKKAKKRSWKQLYLSVWGTCLRVSKHEFKADREIEPSVISTFSMQDAEAGLATDYTKHKHVIRVRIPNGPQFLIRCETERDAVLWIDAMQASINVSCDLDTRPMPEFAFARRRRHRHHQHSRRRPR